MSNKKSIKQYIREEIENVFKEQQLTLPFKSNPADVLNSYIGEKEDQLQDTLAELEMLINDNEKVWAPGIVTRAKMLLNKIEADGKTQIMKIKAMRKLIATMVPKN